MKLNGECKHFSGAEDPSRMACHDSSDEKNHKILGHMSYETIVLKRVLGPLDINHNYKI